MTPEEAEVKLDIIREIAQEIESDEELLRIDSRYNILAKWIETDVDMCDPE